MTSWPPAVQLLDSLMLSTTSSDVKERSHDPEDDRARDDVLHGVPPDQKYVEILL